MVTGPLSARPTQLVLRKYKGKLPVRQGKEYEDQTFDFPIQGEGLHWEADAVARYVRGTPCTFTATFVIDSLFWQMAKRRVMYARQRPRS